MGAGRQGSVCQNADGRRDLERHSPPSTSRHSRVSTSRYEPSVDADVPSGRRVIDAERRVHRLLRARFTSSLLELGVSFAQFEVMEMLHDVRHLHPGAIGRRLLITRQSADHLVHQLQRGSLVETWRLDGGSLGVRLSREGRKRVGHCLGALAPTFDLVTTLGDERRIRLEADLRTWEGAMRPPPWWALLP